MLAVSSLALYLLVTGVAGAPQPIPSDLAVLPQLPVVSSNQTLEHSLAQHVQLPIVLWHGMGDTCCNPLSIGYLKEHLEKKYGAYVVSVNTGGNSAWTDFVSGFYGNVNDQVALVCKTLREDTRLAGGFHLLGFSQGGQFARALVQRCGHVGVNARTLITFGGQHQGVLNVPGCTRPSLNLTEVGICKVAMQALGKGAYLPLIRDHIVQAQYFKDPLDLEAYLEHNVFLPDINNEVEQQRKPLYAYNLNQLDKFVMVRFSEDFTVVPRDSAWFSFFDGNQLIPLKQQKLYTEDWLGLRAMDNAGKLHFDECPGFHMQIDLDWFDNFLQRTLDMSPVPSALRDHVIDTVASTL